MELVAAHAAIRARMARITDGYGIAAGPEHGQYLRFAQALSADSGMRTVALITRGGDENLRLMRSGKAWVKLTGPYRISSSGRPYSDTVPFAHALLEARPDRVVWGSDWPHVMGKGIMPNDGDLCDLLLDWIPDAQLRERVLVDNPAALYGF